MDGLFDHLDFAAVAESFDFKNSGTAAPVNNSYSTDGGYDSSYSSSYDYDSSYDSNYDSNYESNYDSNLDYSDAENSGYDSQNSYDDLLGLNSFSNPMKRHHNSIDGHAKRTRLNSICEEPEENQIQPAGSFDTTPVKMTHSSSLNDDAAFHIDAFLLANFPQNGPTIRRPDQQVAASNMIQPSSFGEQLCSNTAFADAMRQASTPRAPQPRGAPRKNQSSSNKAPVSCPDNPTNLFELKTPLRPKQRKSYEHENRYLNPNPVIGIKDIHKDRPDLRITSGIVSVELVDGNGESLQSDRQRLLGSSSQGALHLLLNPYNLSSTRFQLKIFENSRGLAYRLKFHVVYVTEDKSTITETVLSNTFQVESNKKKSRRGRPQQPSHNENCE